MMKFLPDLEFTVKILVILAAAHFLVEQVPAAWRGKIRNFIPV